jgi:hypothetical protein
MQRMRHFKNTHAEFGARFCSDDKAFSNIRLMMAMACRHGNLASPSDM